MLLRYVDKSPRNLELASQLEREKSKAKNTLSFTLRNGRMYRFITIEALQVPGTCGPNTRGILGVEFSMGLECVQTTSHTKFRS